MVADRIALDINDLGLLRDKALGALDGELSGIVSGQRGVKRHRDGLAVFARNDGADDVTLLDLNALKQRIVHTLLVDVGLKPRALGCHRDKPHHTVAAIDVNQLCDGAKLVGWVVFAVVVDVGLQSVMAREVGLGDLLAQIVAIRAVAMHDLAKASRARKRRGKQLILIVAAVFHKHQRGLGLLVNVDQLPAIVNREHTADLKRHDLARLHRSGRKRQMRLPARADQHRLNVGVCKQLIGIDISKRSVSSSFLYQLDRAVYAIVIAARKGARVGVAARARTRATPFGMRAHLLLGVKHYGAKPRARLV